MRCLRNYPIGLKIWNFIWFNDRGTVYLAKIKFQIAKEIVRADRDGFLIGAVCRRRRLLLLLLLLFEIYIKRRENKNVMDDLIEHAQSKIPVVFQYLRRYDVMSKKCLSFFDVVWACYFCYCCCCSENFIK